MKKILLKNKLEKGQIIPLVVLMFLGIIAMVALIIDGGALMSSRRTAQAAADAGALAGAKRACLGQNDAKSVAENYATVNNRATSALATVVGKQVSVNATVAYPSFFAGIIGHPTLTTSAQATAGCFGVSGKGVVPVGWYCAPNNTGGPYDSAYGCQIQTLSWKLIGPLVTGGVTTVSINDYDGNNPKDYVMSGTSIVDSVTNKIPPNQIYIILNSDIICSNFSCDFNHDGKNDIISEGNRGLLNLATNNYQTHTWLAGIHGTNLGFFKSYVDPFKGIVVMLPVFNYLCNGDPQNYSSCVAGAHSSPPWPIFSGADDYSGVGTGSNVNYHIIAFAPFYVSCVDAHGDCPGYKYARTINTSLNSNEPIVEGYFLTDVDESLDTTNSCAINLGSCSVSLTN